MRFKYDCFNIINNKEMTVIDNRKTPPKYFPNMINNNR